MSITHETTCATADMAEVLGVSVRRLQQLGAGGWIEGKSGRNQWEVIKTTNTYLAFVAACAALGRDPSYQ